MLNKKLMSKGILKDILIVAIGVLVIWIGLQVVFGTQNPFYVVASGSMIPVLEVYDVLIVQGHVPFEDIEVGDIIVFNRPSGHDRVIVHRVASIIDDEPKTIRTKGDANPASIPGTDFPITQEEYIGKVAYVIPQVGYVTQLLKPPINYVIIVIVVGIMVVKQITKKKNEKEIGLQEPFKKSDTNTESTADIPELDNLEKDKAYSNHDNDSSTEAEKQDSEKEQK
ncbi:MAG: signal peptidase I [Nitrosarchaeum sp.]|uniref:signal peptidase I n=1 Tax=Nitrosarchaeum sp. TaxID=2026886 RepID=UPI002DF162CC|nr:signal peptidase I [Nitrosarchaeum sp.]MEC4847687.1 signal peptidase I [Nitrosarchaeum sp.]